MTEEADTTGVPRSFWVIGGIGLVFNLMGCVNFVSQLDPEAVASMPEAYRSIVETRPAWGTLAFAIAVFGGAIGAGLLLLRRSAATLVLLGALVGALVAQLPLFELPAFPAEAAVGGLSQLVVGGFLTWYASRADRRGWMR